MRRAIPLLVALLAALAFSACGAGEEDLVAREVVAQIPWTVPETVRYKVTQRDDVQGSCELTVALDEGDLVPGLEKGDLVLGQDCKGGDFQDLVTVRVAPETLKPIQLDRVIRGPEGDVDCRALYDGSRLNVVWTSGGERREETLDVPSPSYESWSDIFLWRTISFAEGNEERYTDVGSCNQQRSDPKLVGVRLNVKEREQIEVPAGSFEVWRLEVHSEGRTQRAWYETGEARRLIRYDNGSQVFELESAD